MSNSGKLAGKVAVVTGASKGIGAGIARGLAAAGAAVVVNYASSQAGADQTVQAITEAGGQALAVQADVSNPADVKRLFAAANTAFGTVDIVVNNAGVFNFEPIEAVTVEDFHWHYNTNVLGTLLTTQEALNYFPVSGGSIINVSSIASNSPIANSSVYASTKGAIDTLTKALAVELGARHIRVNVVAPGYTETEGTTGIGFVNSEYSLGLVAQTPLGARYGQPEDIAPTVVFLASDDAGWLTGERISASGGVH